MLKTVDSHMWGAAEARRQSLVQGSTCLSIWRKRAPRCWPIGVQRPLWRPIHVATKSAVHKVVAFMRIEKCQCSGRGSWFHAGSSRHGMSRRLHSPVRGGKAVLPRPEAQERIFARGDRGRAEYQQEVEDRGASAVGRRLSGIGCRASSATRAESTRAESARADAGCVQLPRRFQHILLLSHPRRPQVVYRYSTACSESPTRRNPSSFPTHARPFEACEFSQIHPAISGTKRPRQVPRGI